MTEGPCRRLLPVAVIRPPGEAWQCQLGRVRVRETNPSQIKLRARLTPAPPRRPLKALLHFKETGASSPPRPPKVTSCSSLTRALAPCRFTGSGTAPPMEEAREVQLTHSHSHTHTHTGQFTHSYAHTHTHTHMPAQSHLHTLTQLHTLICSHTHTHSHTRPFKHSYIHTHTHTCTLTHTHTLTGLLERDETLGQTHLSLDSCFLLCSRENRVCVCVCV